MSFTFVVGLVIAGVFIFAAILLFSMLAVSKREDRASRHNYKQIDPFVDVTITREGE